MPAVATGSSPPSESSAIARRYSRSAGGRPLVARPEEPDGELRLRLRRGHRDVLDGDRAARGRVPGRLAVGLHEVRIPAGRVEQRGQRIGGELGALPLDGREQCAVRVRAVQPVDPDVAEQPLGVGLRRRTARPAGVAGRPRPPPAAPWPGTAHGMPRTAPTRRRRRGPASRRSAARPRPRRRAASSATSVSSSTRSISMSPESALPCVDRYVDARLPAVPQPRPVRGRPQRERLQHAEHGVDPVRRPMPHRDVPDRAVQRRGQRPPDRGTRARLDLAGPPAQPQGHRAQLAEQDGLADAAQPGEHQAAFRPPARDPLQQHLEACSSESRPASSGGRCPAPGAKGLRIGSTLGRYPAL